MQMGHAAAMTLGIRVSDVTRQKTIRARDVPANATIREFVQKVIARMGLVRNDVEGRPLNYQARLDREGRHLNGAEFVGDALREDDAITLAPNIDAG
jgi:hypothetical protein